MPDLHHHTTTSPAATRAVADRRSRSTARRIANWALPVGLLLAGQPLEFLDGVQAPAVQVAEAREHLPPAVEFAAAATTPVQLLQDPAPAPRMVDPAPARAVEAAPAQTAADPAGDPAPDAEAAPARPQAQQPVEPAPAPQVVTTATTPEQRRQEVCDGAWAMVPSALRTRMAADGVEFRCEGPRKGVQAWYLGSENAIVLHVRDGWTATDAFVPVMHEVGHAIDFGLAANTTTAHRDQWMQMRGLDMCWLCFGDANDDRVAPVGDFAEAFAEAWAGESEPRLGAYTAAQLDWIRSLI